METSKTIFRAALVFLLIALLSGCEPETVLNIDQVSFTIPETGGTQSVSLTANKPWTASSNQSWCRVSPSSGEKGTSTKVTVTCDPNKDYDTRTCVLTFSCGEKTVSAQITQASSNGLLLSRSDYSVTNDAQQVEVEVKANVKFDVTVDAACKDWVTYKGTKGLTNSTVMLDIAKNESYDGREGKVTIKQSDGSLSATVTIRQGQTDGLFVTTSDYELSNGKHTLTVEVKANIEFEVTSGVEWIKYVETKGLKTSQIVLDIAANETFDPRQGTVTVKQKGGDLKGTITVKQAEKSGIQLSKTEFNLTNESQTIDVDVQSNVEYDIVIPESCRNWIVLTETKSLEKKTHIFAIGSNGNYDAREGSITFKQKDGPLSGTVTIRQSQTNGLFVTTSEYELSNGQHTLTVEVKSNVEFEVTSHADWIKYVETKGLKTSQIILNVEANDTFDSREGSVTVKQKNGSMSGIITIKQAETQGIFVSNTEFDLSNDFQTVDVAVTHNVDYSVVIPDACKDWIRIVDTKGLSTKNYTLSISKNESYDNREGTVTFKQKDGPLSGTVTIRQSQSNGLFVTTSEYELSNGQHTLTVEVKSNVEFEVTSHVDWIKYVETKGLKTSQIILNVEANESYDSREGKVSVKQKNGSLSGTITVKQAETQGIFVTKPEFNLTNEAQTVEIEVKHNVEFDAVIPDACKDWIRIVDTKGLSTKNYTLSISKNESYDNREGTVTFKQKDGPLSGTVTIWQSQSNGLFVTTSEYELSNGQHTLTVEVKSNVEFEVTSHADWIKYVETKGLKTSQIILNVEANESYDSREGTVSVKQKNGSLSGTITVKQAETQGIFVTKPEFNLTSEAQTVEVEVKYNVDFSVIIPEECKEWVRQIATKGLEKKIYTFSISKNDTYDNRECSITFKEKKGALSASVTIKQAQTDYLEVGQKEYTVDVGGEIIEIEVKSNVAYNVAIANNALSWLSIVDTKSLSTDKVLVSVAAGDDNTDRKGDIVISYGDMKHTVSVHQYSFAANTIIQFADARIKEKLVAAFDTNKDGELSIKEAQQVKSIDGVFGKIKTYKSFDEFQYFTGVKEISAETFSGWTLLTSIKIPEGIESLPSLAFDNCVSLTTVGIPKSLKYFYGNYCVFVGCTSLKNLEIADLTSWCETDFKGWLFSGDTKIEHLFLNGKEIVDLVIPDNTTRISGAAFENLLNLRTVVIPDSVKGIENAAFANCTGLKSITIGKGVKKICYDTFLNCTSLTKVEISDLSAWCEINYDATTFINHDSVPGGSPLYYARHLYLNGKEVKGALTIPSGCTKTGVFYGCDITSVTIPNTVTSISPYAFQGCRALTSVEIPNSVTSIENYAFQGCTGLASVEIPNSVTGIWKYAFQGCTGLTSVEIPSSVTSIGTYAFQGCKNLKKVVIPSSTKNVEKYSFYDIAPSVTLISGVTSDRNGNPTNIIDNRFNGSINLIIPDSVTEIGYYRWCDVLVSVVIPESVSSIGSRAFSNCKNLTSVTIPESVMSIGFEAFASCNSLTSVIIPESVRVIEESAFHATSLQAIEIPKNVKKIGKMAFRNCPLKKIIVHPTTPPEAEDREFFDGSTCKIQVPSASVESYRTTRWWDTYADRIVAIGN